LNDFFSRTLGEINSPKNVTLEVANRAYAEKTMKILDSYTKMISEKYGGDFEQVNFKQAASDAVKQINAYVSKKTHDKINNLLSDDVVTSDTRYK
jgi:serine protease inhibitor